MGMGIPKGLWEAQYPGIVSLHTEYGSYLKNYVIVSSAGTVPRCSSANTIAVHMRSC
jgi:hypothetical protein